MKRLFVENFRDTTTYESIVDLFQSKGKVESVTIHTDRSGASSHAFVAMENDVEASTAIRTLNNSNWNGLRLTVTSAQQPPLRLPGFRGGSSVLARKQK
jgi:RNA recognition motif-containing protein